MSGIGVAIVSLLLLGLASSPFFAIGLYGRLKQARARIRDLEAAERARKPIDDAALALEAAIAERQAVQASITALAGRANELNSAIEGFGQRIDVIDVGLGAPRFKFGEAKEYALKLDEIRGDQERMVKAGTAATCLSEWSVGGSRAEGKRVTAKIIKLMLRAFNGESDSLVAKVRYDNVHAYGDRVRKSFEAINKLGEGFHCRIDVKYLDLKLAELRLVHEYQEKVQEEKEEQRRIREEMREEERRAKEIAKAEKEAADDEARYTKALGRARQDVLLAHGAEQEILRQNIANLEANLAEAKAKAERAKSQAQLTRAGHVYVLSNVGSFGDQVFKVGMTRRLEPQERVDELGDASVPFGFDVHALIYTEDAPKLERALHVLLDHARVNKVNFRKEFFRTTIDDIERVVRAHHGEFKLTKMAEAIEFRKTLALLSVPQASPSEPTAAPQVGAMRLTG